MKNIVAILLFITIGITNIYAQTQIRTANDLNNIRGDLGGDYIQIADIDLSVYSSGEGWEPLGNNEDNFTGSYDGNGFTITNMFINRPIADYQGLFGIAYMATLLNITLSNIDVTGNDYVGGLVGFNNYTYIQACSVEGDVTGNGKVAGYIGRNSGSTVQSSYFTGSVNGNSDVGGFIGWNSWDSTVGYCFANGIVNADGYYVGGLVGRNGSSTVRNCYAIVEVTGNNRVAGLVGWNYSYSAIDKCYAAGSVSGSGNLVGGLVGEQLGATTDLSYWDVEVSGQSSSAGGEGRTTDEMTYPHAANTYMSWDFSDIWGEDVGYAVNNGYPYLQNVTVSVDDPPQVDNHIIATYPNPFKGSTSIDFMVDKTTRGDLSVYNIRGQKVCTLYSGLFQGKMTSHFTWDGKDSVGRQAGSGVYLIILQTDDVQIQKKVMLTR